MDTHGLIKRFSSGEIPVHEKVADAATYLNSLSKREAGIAIDDIKILEACVRMVISCDVELIETSLFEVIGTYLKTSPAFQSADYLEDYFDLDFENENPSFVVDYTGNYTFVPDSMLPAQLAAERTYALMLARYFFQHVYAKTSARQNLESVALPGLDLDSATIHETRMAGSVYMGADFTDCHFQSVGMGRSNLKKCTFTGCHFDNVGLNECELEGATFDRCIFHGASLRAVAFGKASFTHCQFVETELCFIDFGASDLSCCTFDKCWISHAGMGQVSGLAQKQLDSFFGDDSTRLPAHLEEIGDRLFMLDIPCALVR
ncbi:pentapeptide repeat-containing protein [Desulfoluna butyratoxydans]|uniref:Pentapeptide repeat n=1 Tax=Desulfoluna butyratoxydans TaxID=231438 RepID=A0A4U8YLE9_9BACT|nr:pentapeptide repeat-containing protein [Desulfoluna butyratoxydans]VFQ44775.1 pentapeptide repeat [Desulfoluna butyratoxydans]